MTPTTKARTRKSIALTSEESKQLAAYVKGFRFVIEAADNIGISRQVLDRVLVVKAGAPETIEKIKVILGTA